jgi:hypothetical protein
MRLCCKRRSNLTKKSGRTIRAPDDIKTYAGLGENRDASNISPLLIMPWIRPFGFYLLE